MKIIKLQSCDGIIFEINEDIVSMCTTIKNILKGKNSFKNSLGGEFLFNGLLFFKKLILLKIKKEH